MKPLRFLVFLIVILAAPWAVRAAERVDLELLIATDVSRSIDEDEARLQREGVAAAFLDPGVIGAISSGALGRIAVAYIDYSSQPFNRLVADWRVIRGQADAAAFAELLLKSPLTYGRRTSIADAIEHGVDLIEKNAYQGTRRVIDVSGDGPNNHGNHVNTARDAAVAKGIIINGLPIMTDPGPGLRSRYYLPDLDQYYAGCVIGGTGAFQVPARDFKDFARAIKKKLILEIAGLTPNQHPAKTRLLLRASAKPPVGPGYRLGCDVGERRRYRAWTGSDDP
jgi:hypothetical protein